MFKRLKVCLRGVQNVKEAWQARSSWRDTQESDHLQPFVPCKELGLY